MQQTWETQDKMEKRKKKDQILEPTLITIVALKSENMRPWHRTQDLFGKKNANITETIRVDSEGDY